jgi:hypothetical protein
VMEINFSSLALGPHPQRELTLMPRSGFAWPSLGMAAGAQRSLASTKSGSASSASRSELGGNA